ncbi:hypothetical protein RV10_GL001894 [Enterococcus pallens]|nr:hypothetical protein RV10_GL001894 [Enterococcus pallens]
MLQQAHSFGEKRFILIGGSFLYLFVFQITSLVSDFYS